ncbi:MAG: helix-turn-helix transcriptional regulator [Chitinophagales bacterium]
MNTFLTTEKTALSKREKEVVNMLSRGFSTKEISTLLFISFHTVDTHRKHVLEKLGAKNMPHAVRLAMQKGLLAD